MKKKPKSTTIKLDQETAAYLSKLAARTPLRSRPAFIRELAARYGVTVREELNRPIGKGE